MLSFSCYCLLDGNGFTARVFLRCAAFCRPRHCLLLHESSTHWLPIANREKKPREALLYGFLKREPYKVLDPWWEIVIDRGKTVSLRKIATVNIFFCSLEAVYRLNCKTLLSWNRRFFFQQLTSVIG